MGETFSERKLSVKDVSIHVYGDTGWSEFYWDFAAKRRKDGSPVATKGRETQVYHKEQGQWRLVHVHYSGMPFEAVRSGHWLRGQFQSDCETGFQPGLICGYALAIERGEEIRLWPNGAPGSEGETAPEVFDAAANSKLPKRFTVVHYPSIYVFLAPKEKANGMAVVVAPGGGHSQLVIDKEGWEIADWLNRNGIAAFVLKYRLARAPGSHYTVDRDALADAARAVRTVRSRAAEWGVDPARIGFMGFSAGGELAALIETRFDAGNAGCRRSGRARQLAPRFCRGHLSRIQARIDHRAKGRASGISDVHR